MSSLKTFIRTRGWRTDLIYCVSQWGNNKWFTISKTRAVTSDSGLGLESRLESFFAGLRILPGMGSTGFGIGTNSSRVHQNESLINVQHYYWCTILQVDGHIQSTKLHWARKYEIDSCKAPIFIIRIIVNKKHLFQALATLSNGRTRPELENL